MGKCVAEFTMSLDGFVAGKNDDVRPIFGWYGSGDTDFVPAHSDRGFKVWKPSADLLRDSWGQIGVIVTGRRDFDVSNAWGGKAILGVPMLIVTHHPPQEWLKPDSPFTFITEGVESAIAQAQRIAGDKVVGVGGTQIVRQCLKAGLIDELVIHLVPVLLGEGIHLFEHLGIEPITMEIMNVIAVPDVTHLRYRVVK